MLFVLPFAWLLLVIANSVGCLKIYLGNSELSPKTLKSILSGPLLNYDDNLIPLLRVLRSGKLLGLVHYYEEYCSSWSYETFSRIRAFILKFPTIAQLLLTAKCYNKLSRSVREGYSLDVSSVIKDFNGGILAIYENPILSSQLINKLKFLSFIEKFDPDADICTADFLDPKDFINAEGNVPYSQAYIQGLILPYLYRAMEMASGPLYQFEAQSMEQIVPVISDYAKKIYKENSFAFFIIYTSFSILKKIESGRKLFTDALDVIHFFTKKSTSYYLFESVNLSSEYPYGKKHFAIRKGISKIELNNRSLIRYAIILVRASRTPFETCRFFLGAKNIRRIQSARGLPLHKDIYRCLTSEEWVLHLRRWHTLANHVTFANLPNLEESILEMTDYFLERWVISPITINSEAGEVVFERSIRFLIKEVNAEWEIVKIRAIESSNDQEITFPFSLIHNTPHSFRILALVTLVILMNIHFSFALSVEGGILRNIQASHSAGIFQGKQAKTLKKLFWLLNVRPNDRDEVTKLAKQIKWDSDN